MKHLLCPHPPIPPTPQSFPVNSSLVGSSCQLVTESLCLQQKPQVPSPGYSQENQKKKREQNSESDACKLKGLVTVLGRCSQL